MPLRREGRGTLTRAATLTTGACDQHNPQLMIRTLASVAALAPLLAIAGCGLFYQAGTRIKASHMADTLKQGESMVDVHKEWGEPDIREYPTQDSEVWSYPYKTNSNDIMAAVVYTTAKEGDKGTFLDLKFVDGRLVSWSEADHTMPPKEGAGLNYGFGGVGGTQPSGTAHY